MAGRPSTKKATPTGARLAALRKAVGLSQVQLVEAVSIPQRTLSFYEQEATHLPSTLLPELARALGVTIEESIGVSETKMRKREPKSQLERQLEIVLMLPRQTQQKIMAVLDAFITQQQVFLARGASGERLMQVDCPKGWQWVKRIGNITFEDHRVEICNGVCDSADLCKRANCEFYDISEDATGRFLQAQAKEHILEGIFPIIH